VLQISAGGGETKADGVIPSGVFRNVKRGAGVSSAKVGIFSFEMVHFDAFWSTF